MVGTVKKSTETMDLTMVAILLIPSPLLSSGGSHEPIQYHAPLLQISTKNARGMGGMMKQNLLLARKCLQLIRDIADRGASSGDDGQVVYAL
jgi:hypothetical protein